MMEHNATLKELHQARLDRRRQQQASSAAAAAAGSESSSSAGTETRDEDAARPSVVRIEIAYLLLTFGGTLGAHHAYLGRPADALVHFCTFGWFGYGTLLDVFLIPRYVCLARSDPSDEEFQRLRTIIDAFQGVPPFDGMKIVGMHIFGGVFGQIGSCFVPPGLAPSSQIVSLMTAVCKALGSSLGVYLVANTGVCTLSCPYWHLFLACLVGCSAGYPTVVGAWFAYSYRTLRPTMKPKSNATLRLGKHLLLSVGCLILLFVAVFIQLGISYEVIRNVYNSEFFKEFDFQEFRSRKFEYLFDEGYLKNAFDLDGGRAARKTLGVSKNANMKDIKAAYKELALQYHPDKILQDDGSSSSSSSSSDPNKFLKIQEAYDTLKNIEKRRSGEKSPPAAGKPPRPAPPPPPPPTTTTTHRHHRAHGGGSAEPPIAEQVWEQTRTQARRKRREQTQARRNEEM